MSRLSDAMKQRDVDVEAKSTLDPQTFNPSELIAPRRTKRPLMFPVENMQKKKKKKRRSANFYRVYMKSKAWERKRNEALKWHGRKTIHCRLCCSST